jgi:hypothetical protein
MRPSAGSKDGIRNSLERKPERHEKLDPLQSHTAGCTLIDVETWLKEILRGLAAVALALSGAALIAQPAVTIGPPPSSGGFIPLSEVHAGMKATAWTVFTGTAPEAMDVEILGVLHGARGPGHDLILAQLHGAKPEYTGVVAGMSGSPVYVGTRLMGSLSYRIGQFSKDPIAGITPIEQMLEVRDLPINNEAASATGDLSRAGLASASTGPASDPAGAGMTFQAMETPLLMSGFRPEAIRLWQEKMAGTGLGMVAAGGMAGSSGPGETIRAGQLPGGTVGHSAADFPLVPGSAVSAQLVRGDLEIAATCTVTYIDPKQLLACGHPILQAGPVSLPMTTAEVVATLASPLNAFKIINTGRSVGAFTEDRDAGIRGLLGAEPKMIPLHMTIRDGPRHRQFNVEVLDLPSLTPQAVMVSLYEVLLESNQSTLDTSYHVTGRIDLDGYAASPLDIWAPAGDLLPAPMMAAVNIGERFMKLYSNSTRLGAVKGIELDVEAIPKRVQVELETARIVSGDIVHAGDRVVVEATVHPWEQPARNVRISVTLPARLSSGNLRLLVSDAGTLDRTLDQPRLSTRGADMQTVLAQARGLHPADRIYVSLLVPEAQANMTGQTLLSVPLSMANALEPLRTAQDVNLNGESAELAGEAPAGGVLSGFEVLNLHIEPGGGLN